MTMGARVKDDDGGIGTAQTVVQVDNLPPVVEAGPDQKVSKRHEVELDGSFTDPGVFDAPHSVEIDWGDGTIEDGDVDEAGGSGTVTGRHAYGEDGEYTVKITVTDKDEDSGFDTLKVTVKGIELLAASYDVLSTTLTLTFNNPIDPDLTCFDAIGMEVGNSGRWDFALSEDRGLTVNQVVANHDPDNPERLIYDVVIDTIRDQATTENLAVAAFVTNRGDEIDLLLGPNAFTDADGHTNLQADVPLEITAGGYDLGAIGDVTGNGEVTAYDGALILQSIVWGQTVFPPYQTALQISNWLTAQGYECDIMTDTADTDDSGDVSSYDASLVLQLSAGLISEFPCETCAPVADATPKNGQLRVDSYDDQRLDISIDVDNVENVYSADIVMTYNPQILTVADVSRASSTSGWLFEHGTIGSGNLRISLAGVSQPSAAGSLVTVSFDAASADAIEHLDITEFRLNGGKLKTAIKNLPKSFALLQNYPNPFNPETWIPYQLSMPVDVSIAIYNVNGQMVRRLELGNKMPGHYIDKSRAAYWDGRNHVGEAVSSGIYFYQLQTGRDTSVRKMIIVR